MANFRFFSKPRTLSEPSRHARRAFQSTGAPTLSGFVLILTLLFLFFPLLVVIFYSFNAGKSMSFTGFSLRWYHDLIFKSRPLWIALWNSFVIALVSAAVSTVIGTLAAVGINWYKFYGKTFIKVISFLPMVLPEVIIGISTVIFFARLRIPLGMFTIAAAHITFCLPFVYLMVRARIDEFDFSIVEAARDLGATERQAMLKVVLPAIFPGVISGFMMAVTMSLEDFVITFFVKGPGSTTLPLYIYQMIRTGVSPVVNALSCVLIAATVLIAFSLRKFLKAFAAAK
ncbi:MAG: ABC transporter permease [Spirochaetaceae bacterium]|jgi:spermidine/putrescine transport system permease protein|nr:ABC transporter permease [Spirochaetaceae bacterium]